ncbi:hypothetical protein P692DRAFT_20828825 [Suillus brevipes Sb2]|nr:hypothetical protein P692DRAFT_20828825 [Suillus brevipes Sb2]
MSLAVESVAQANQLCKLSVHSMRRSLVVRLQGQRISIPSWSNVSLLAVMVALEHSIKLR